MTMEPVRNLKFESAKFQVLKLKDLKYGIVTSVGGLLFIKFAFKRALENEEINEAEREGIEYLISEIDRVRNIGRVSEKQATRIRAYEKILAKCKTEKARENKKRELARNIFKKWKYGRFIPREGPDSLTQFEKELLGRYYPSWREEL